MSYESLSKEELIEILKSLGKDRPVEITVGRVIDLYVANLEQRLRDDDISSDMVTHSVYDLLLFKAAYGHQTISQCKQFDLSGFIRDRPALKSAYSKARVSSIVVCSFNWAKEQGLIENVPYHRVKNLGPKKPRRPCTAQEYCALMRNGNRAIRRLLFFLRRTGCRTCEARLLTWADVRLDGDEPGVILERHKTSKKTGKARMFGLDAGTAAFLRNLRRQAPPLMAHVFLNTSGKPWSRRAISLHIRRMARRIGLDEGVAHRVSAYCLRHFYISQAIQAGMTTRQIADQVGHETTAVIDKIYGASSRANAAHLGRVANEATRARLREKPTKRNPTGEIA
jgi:integrase